METAFQKIVKQHLVRVLPDGSIILRLDLIGCHEITTPNAILDMEERGCDVVKDSKMIKTMIDHVNPACTTNSAIQGRIMREWSRKHGVEFLDVGRNGICHAIIPEKGWILPGQTMVMGDSHTCTHGAFGAFAAGVGTTELECAMITGLWVCPPQKVIRVNFVGDLPANVFAKDLILELIRRIGVKGANNCVIEFGGPVIDEMSMEARMTMANMVAEAGATSGMMPVDMTTVLYLLPAIARNYGEEVRPSQILRDLSQWNSDPGANYDKVIEMDVTSMTPVTTINFDPGQVVPVSELAGKKVDQVYIGSCTNGRREDLLIAASIFRQMRGRVADNLRCIVVPATQEIYLWAMREGLLETFAEAGCIVSAPTCGACLGMSNGVIAPGEISVSTTNRNFSGRMGKGGMVHLVSPATAAMTALTGKITEPSVEVCGVAVRYAHSRRTAINQPVKPTGWQGTVSEVPDYAELARPLSAGVSKDFSGRAFYLPMKDVNTDLIIPATYLDETDKAKMGEHCLEDVVTSPADREMMRLSQILVTGENCGCGSSREHAPWAFQGLGINCVIAPSFARIFERNMFAIGNLCVTLPQEDIDRLFQERPEIILINWKEGLIEGKRYGETVCQANFSLSENDEELIHYGGSVSVMIRLAAELQAVGKL